MNIVSICFAIFLIGLSIDFSVSYIHRYLALRQELYELPDALREAAETTGSGILISAATAALAFSTALLTGFPGVAELGLIAAMGVILCAAAVFWFLPALIAISDADVDVEHLPQPMPAAKLVGWLTAWPVPAAAAAAVLVLLVLAKRAVLCVVWLPADCLSPTRENNIFCFFAPPRVSVVGCTS